MQRNARSGVMERWPTVTKCTPESRDRRNSGVAVVHLSSAHRADDVRICAKECQSLANAGYNVTIIASHHRSERFAGVNIHAVPPRRSRFLRMTLSVWNVYREALRHCPDICHLHDPELIPAGLLLKLHGKLVIYDVHEDLPLQVLTKLWLPRPLRRLVATVSAVIARVAGSVFDGIVAATPNIAAKFPCKKTVVVQNYPLLDESPSASPTPYTQRAPRVVYVGVISRMRGVMEMIEAIQRVPPPLGACLTLVGPFDSPGIESELQYLSSPTVELLGFQPFAALRELLSNARVGLVLLHPTASYMDAVPTKLFEYMSAGLPVIASDFPLWRKVVEDARCGLLVDPLDPGAIAKAIQQLLEDPAEAEQMGRRGRELSRKRFNWATEQLSLLRVYDLVAQRKG